MPCERARLGGAEEGEEVFICVMVEEPPPCATYAWGRTRGGDSCHFSSKSQRESRHTMLWVSSVKAVRSQHVSSLGGNELPAVRMHVPISLQRGLVQLGARGTLLNLPWGEAGRWAPPRQREQVPPSLLPSPSAYSSALMIRSCHTSTTVRWSALLSWN